MHADTLPPAGLDFRRCSIRDAAVREEQHFVLSNLPPSATQKWLAAAVVAGLFVVFASITFGPLSGVQLRRVDAFVAVYVTAMFVTDSITAILLYAQFSIVRSRSILVIASGYLFTALILIPFVLVFPGVFAPGTWSAACRAPPSSGCRSTPVSPLFVIAYALSKDEDPGKRLWQGTVGGAIALSVAATVAIVLLRPSFA